MVPGADHLALSLGSSGLLGAVAAGLLAAALPLAIGRDRGAPRAGLCGAGASFFAGVAGGMLLAAPVVAASTWAIVTRARSGEVEFEAVGRPHHGRESAWRDGIPRYPDQP